MLVAKHTNLQQLIVCVNHLYCMACGALIMKLDLKVSAFISVTMAIAVLTANSPSAAVVIASLTTVLIMYCMCDNMPLVLLCCYTTQQSNSSSVRSE
jgi:hypothetical protein